jgi:hypothetical protein
VTRPPFVHFMVYLSMRKEVFERKERKAMKEGNKTDRTFESIICNNVVWCVRVLELDKEWGMGLFYRK